MTFILNEEARDTHRSPLCVDIMYGVVTVFASGARVPRVILTIEWQCRQPHVVTCLPQNFAARCVEVHPLTLPEVRANPVGRVCGQTQESASGFDHVPAACAGGADVFFAKAARDVIAVQDGSEYLIIKNNEPYRYAKPDVVKNKFT